MSNNPIAIARQVTTVSITFSEKPSEERRRELKASGFRYENGNWYKSDSQSHLADEATVAKLIAA